MPFEYNDKSFNLHPLEVKASGSHLATTDGTSSGNKFGGMIRAGVETGHFRAGIEYNLVPSTTLKDSYDPNKTEKSKNGYLGIKIGFFLGGGRLD